MLVSPDSHADRPNDSGSASAAFSRLVHLFKIEKDGLHVVLVYALGIGIASLAAPLGVQMLVSAIAFGGLVQPIVVLSLLVLVALAFGSVLRAAQSWAVERIQQRLFVRVATDLAHRLPSVLTRSFDSKHGPALVNHFLEVVTLQKGASMLLLDGLFVALQVVLGGILLALYHPVLLAFAGVVLIAIVVILVVLGGKGSETSIKESKAKYALVAWFEEIARQSTLFRDHAGHRFAATRSNELIRAYVDKRKAHYRIVFRQTVAFLTLQAVATAALLAIGGILVLNGQLTLGQLVAAELILTSVVAGFAKFGKYIEVYYDLIAAMDKLGQLVELPLERESGQRFGRDRDPLSLRIACTVDTPEMDGGGAVQLDVAKGARVALVGPNGSGKSIYLDLAYGLREPASGRVEIDGYPMRELSLRDVREQVALVRGIEIFDGTIMENLCMGRDGTSLEEVRDALAEVGMWDEIATLPDGLETRLMTDGRNLSVGQAQRIAIARAILGRPRCLLLDQALDDLDPESRAIVTARLLRPDAPWTAIVATHDPHVVAACSERFVVERGRVRALFEGGST